MNIEMRGINKSFGSNQVLKDAGFVLKDGEVHALMGENGAGKNIVVVGFDATDDAIASIKEGKMAGTIAQQPALIGSTAVENALKLMAGETIEKSIPVEVTLITKDNA